MSNFANRIRNYRSDSIYTVKEVIINNSLDDLNNCIYNYIYKSIFYGDLALVCKGKLKEIMELLERAKALMEDVHNCQSIIDQKFNHAMRLHNLYAKNKISSEFLTFFILKKG